MKLTSDRILVEPIAEQSTAGFERVQTKQLPPQKGKIIAAGPGRKEDPMVLCVGDTILYQKHAGTEVVIEGKSYVIMRESDAFCAL